MNSDQQIKLKRLEQNEKEKAEGGGDYVVVDNSIATDYWESQYGDNLDHHCKQNFTISKDFLKLISIQKDDEMYNILKNANGILEFGCGTGEFSRMLSEHFDKKKVVGVDISEKSIDFANKSYAAQYTTFLCTDVLVDGFERAGQNDVAITSNTLEHFRDPHAVIDLFFDNGFKYVILLVPYKQPCTDGYSSEGGAGHVYEFSEESMDKYEVCGMEIFESRGWGYSSCGETPLQMATAVKRKG